MARRPTAYEAVLAGCPVIIPRFDPPRQLPQIPRSPADSQHPYILEHIGAPYVHSVLYQSAEDVVELVRDVMALSLPPALVPELHPDVFTERLEANLRSPLPCAALKWKRQDE